MRLSSGDPARSPFPIFPKPACPQCGALHFAASATEFLEHGEIRSTWSCESCDHEIRTVFAFVAED